MKPFYTIYLLFLLASCDISFKKKVPQIEAYNAIMQTDAAFSAVAKAEGFKKASLSFMEPDAALLKSNSLPVVGADAVNLLSSLADSSFSLQWQPQGAFVAQSCDLGYTYGGYTLTIKEKVSTGSYVLIWKKQLEGDWKYCLGNINDAFLEMDSN